MFKISKRIALVACLLCLILAGLAWYVHAGFGRAQRHLATEDFGRARDELRLYLRFFRDDPQALLKLAESYARDQDLAAEQSAQIAVRLLDRIPTSSPSSAEAKVQSGRLRLLILNQPCHAESDLRDSLAKDPDAFDANYMMWKLLDLTRRYHQVDPYFLKCMATAGHQQKSYLLRDWYFSQFSTFVAASQIDQLMGTTKPGESTEPLTEYKRFVVFSLAEEECALNHALLADWCEQYHIDVEKWEHFEDAWNRANNESAPYVFAILFDMLLEAGRFEEAEEVFQAWPEPRSGYDYDLRRGIYLMEIKESPQEAIEACRQAIARWPGTIDWQLHHRLSGLLVRVNKVKEAEQYRQEAERLQQLMEVNFHQDIREKLFTGNDDEVFAKMSQFYADIGRPVEAQAWKELENKSVANKPEDNIPKSSKFNF